jgi:uncharacterized membrane protein YfcA
MLSSGAWADVGVLLAMFLAGLLASAINAVAGGGSLITFPVLVALGIPELSANATNSASLWLGSLSSAIGFWPQLKRTRRHLGLLIVPTALGSAVGVALLVSGGSRVFKYAVPGLVLAATVLLALQPQIKRWVIGSRRKLPAAVGVLLQFLICIYGGYFGAGMGILMLALMGLYIDGDLHEHNALKAWLGLLVNLLAGVLFWQKGLLDGRAMLAVGSGSLVGGYVAARIAQRVNAGLLRRAIVVLGVLLAVWFAVRAWR